jgi:hypothetical protein
MKRAAMLRWVCFFGMLLFVSTSIGHAFDLGIRGHFWLANIDGQIQGNNSSKGSVLNLQDDLDFGYSWVPFGEAFVGIGRHHLSLGVTYFDQSETHRAGRSVVFAGKAFDSGVELDSNFQWTMLEMEYSFTLLDLENVLAGFSLDAFLAGRYQTGTMSVESGSQKGEIDFSWIRPLGGLQLHLGFLADVLEVRLKGGGYYASDEHLVDAVAEISLTPFAFMDLGLGYRFLSVDIDSDGLDQDYDLAGPFAGLTISF